MDILTTGGGVVVLIRNSGVLNITQIREQEGEMTDRIRWGVWQVDY
jgi:hypothetical protein